MVTLTPAPDVIGTDTKNVFWLIVIALSILWDAKAEPCKRVMSNEFMQPPYWILLIGVKTFHRPRIFVPSFTKLVLLVLSNRISIFETACLVELIKMAVGCKQEFGSYISNLCIHTKLWRFALNPVVRMPKKIWVIWPACCLKLHLQMFCWKFWLLPLVVKINKFK